MFAKGGIVYAGSLERGIRVVDARVVNDLSMLVAFSNGETRLFDASGLLDMPAFAPLADGQTFRDFEVDHSVVTWQDGEIDLAPEAMYEGSYAYEDPETQVA